MVAARPLPASLQSIVKGFSADGQAKINDLHGKYGITDDGLEAFEMTAKISEDSLPKLEAFLNREASARAPKVAAGTRSTMTTPAAKKRKPAGLGLGSSSLGSLLGGIGRSQATSVPASQASTGTSRVAEMDTTTPTMFAQESARTPEKSPKSGFQVSLKTSHNGKLVLKPRGATEHPRKWNHLGDETLWQGKRNGAYEWMNETLEDRVHAQDERLALVEDSVTAALQELYPEAKVGRVGGSEQAEVVLCGRVVCEGLEGKLNERAIILEGSRASSGSARMRLNVAECKSFAAFPGQIVGVVGRSGSNGSAFHARDYMAGLPIPVSMPAAMPAAGVSGSAVEAPLHMMVASGPYCLRDGLDYSPLERVLEVAAAKKPDALILFGPLLDASNQRVIAGDPVLPGDDDPRPFEDVYEFVLQKLGMGIRALRGACPKTQIFLMPALDEVMHFHPMPQPPYTSSMIREADQRGWLTRMASNPLHVQMLPNPAHIRLSGLKMSLTSCDALQPLLRDILLRPEGKKVEESLRQLLRQRSFFPVLPRDPPQVSEARAAALDFPEGVPDVCIFPSQCGGLSGTFVEETAFLNPGSVCKPAALGTFAEMWVVPRSEHSGPFNQRVRMDIHKLERSSH